MSLKDRLNGQNKIYTNIEDTEIAPKETKEFSSPDTDDGFGLLDSFLIDENLNSIYVSGAKNVYVEKRGAIHKVAVSFKDNSQLIDIIKNNAMRAGVDDFKNASFLKFNYKEGINICATLPPISTNPVMKIKCYFDKNATIKNLQDNKIISKEIAMIFEALASVKLNILIIGNPQSLKTTILSAMAKLLALNSRGILVDFKNEIKIKSNNFTTYDFSIIKDDKLKSEVLSSIFDFNPDKIFINDCDDKTLYEATYRAMTGYKGMIVTMNALNTSDAIEKLAGITLKQNPAADLNYIKSSIYNAFDLAIVCSKNETGKRIITKVSELKSDICGNKINDIFYINENNEHSSTGCVPEFLETSGILPVNANIFTDSYKHTYTKKISVNRKPSNDLIKKIKDNAENETFANSSYNVNTDEIVKKVQERFEELKKNAKMLEQSEKTNSPQEVQSADKNELESNGQ